MRKDLPCADCGSLMWNGPDSLPAGQARCLPCRRASPTCKTRSLPRTPREAECAWCRTAFPARRKDQKYCSKPCLAAAMNVRENRKVRRTCEVCAQPYAPTYSAQRTCGRECGKWFNHKISCVVEWADCAICRRVYVQASGRGFGTCSPSCADEARAILFPAKPKDDGWKYEDRECPTCATVFRLVDRHENMGPNVYYCSKRCGRKASKLRRKVREYGSNGTWRWSDFMRIAARFNYCCAYCGEKPDRLDPDHVIPLAKGGSNTTSNLLPACPPCNSQKTDMLLDEWAAHRLRNGQQPRATSWADDDPRYYHLTTVRSSRVAA